MLEVTSIPVFFLTSLHRLMGQHMEILSKIYKYEVDLHPYSMLKKSSFVVYAITDSLGDAERMLRREYPSLFMYSASPIPMTTLVNKNCLFDATVFDVGVKTNHGAGTSLKVLMVTNTLTEVIEMCSNRYRLDIREIEVFPLKGNVMMLSEGAKRIAACSNSISCM